MLNIYRKYVIREMHVAKVSKLTIIILKINYISHEYLDLKLNVLGTALHYY